MIDQPQEEKPAVVDEKKSALTVVIQSWWTPAIAVLALVAGLLIGYFGRPMLNNSSDTVGDIAAVTTPVTTAAVDQPTSPTATIDPTAIAENQKQLMDYLVSNTVHFKGDPNALVTIIEFSDYQ
jgi:hypothetical protein